MIEKLVAVRFNLDVDIPRIGERKGLSLRRVAGGNEELVMHEILCDWERRIVVIASLDGREARYTPFENVVWMSPLGAEDERTILAMYEAQGKPYPGSRAQWPENAALASLTIEAQPATAAATGAPLAALPDTKVDARAAKAGAPKGGRGTAFVGGPDED